MGSTLGLVPPAWPRSPVAMSQSFGSLFPRLCMPCHRSTHRTSHLSPSVRKVNTTAPGDQPPEYAAQFISGLYGRAWDADKHDASNAWYADGHKSAPTLSRRPVCGEALDSLPHFPSTLMLRRWRRKVSWAVCSLGLAQGRALIVSVNTK